MCLYLCLVFALNAAKVFLSLIWVLDVLCLSLYTSV